MAQAGAAGLLTGLALLDPGTGPGRRGDSEVDVFANSDLVFFVSKDKGGQGSDSGLGTRAATRRELEVVRCTHCTLSYSSSLHVHTLNLCIQYVLSPRPICAIYDPRAVISSPVGPYLNHIISYNSSTSKYNSSTQHITSHQPLHGLSTGLLLPEQRDEPWPTGFSRRGQGGQGMT